MRDGIMLTVDEDGTARIYDDTYDIVIHCESQEEHDKAMEKLMGMTWVPCSERLPKKERRTYWVCTDAETQHECRWTNNRFGMTELDEWGWSIFDTPQYTKVIAWMPLPEPYKEGTR